jgi:hypothetical protein
MTRRAVALLTDRRRHHARGRGRHHGPIPLVIFVAFGFGVLAPDAHGQATDADGLTRLDLGVETGRPGTHVTLPVVLEVPEGVEVWKTVSEIAFSNSLLTFVEARAGVAADLAEAQIKTEVRADQNKKDTSIITVTVTSSSRAIGSGIVASLSFKLSKDAPNNQTITLAHRPRAFAAAKDPRPIEPIAGRDGEIEVGGGPPPVLACFFYMH